jgi:U32 family peptidase
MGSKLKALLLFYFSYKLSNMRKIELLSPAGNLEKLKYAIHYGADAVYCGIPDFSLRVRINQFNERDLREAAKYAHERKRKIYITLNIYAHNQHLERIEKHLKFLKKLNIDGVIVSDPGIINLVKKYLPKVDIHLSTQANATNWQAVKFWTGQGIKRIILAREVTLAEIKEIRKHNPNVELEYFVHGAMCMSYSGRCILSKWMTDRSANLGDCSQPCRWAYKSVKNSRAYRQAGKCKAQNKEKDFLYLNIEEKMERFNLDIEEDRHGTYIFNSSDLNLIEHVEDLINAGVDCLKIEGRAKSAYYLAIVTRAYRKVIDVIEKELSKNKIKQAIQEQKAELDNLVNRGYTKGFLLEKEPEHNFSGKHYGNKFQFVGEIDRKEDGMNVVRVHNEIFFGNKIEAITPNGNVTVKIKKILDHDGEKVREAHGGHNKKYHFIFDKILPSLSLIRKKI